MFSFDFCYNRFTTENFTDHPKRSTPFLILNNQRLSMEIKIPFRACDFVSFGLLRNSKIFYLKGFFVYIEMKVKQTIAKIEAKRKEEEL